LLWQKALPVEWKSTKKGKLRRVGHLKMAFIEDLKASTVTPVVEKSISSDSSIDSDDSTSYNQLKEVIAEYSA
jgi:hypothetical protein